MTSDATQLRESASACKVVVQKYWRRGDLRMLWRLIWFILHQWRYYLQKWFILVLFKNISESFITFFSFMSNFTQCLWDCCLSVIFVWFVSIFRVVFTSLSFGVSRAQHWTRTRYFARVFALILPASWLLYDIDEVARWVRRGRSESELFSDIVRGVIVKWAGLKAEHAGRQENMHSEIHPEM